MDAQSLYTRYHRLIVTMAEGAPPHPGSGALLHDLLARFDREVQALPAESGRRLRDELAEQFELRLLRTTSTQAREIFALAVKHLD